MAEQDGYIPGVPCWVDTTQPDPEAAAGLLRRPVRVGVRGRDAAGGARQVLHRPDSRRRRGRCRARSPRARRRAADVEHLRLGRERRRDRRPRSATPAARVLMEPVDVMDSGRMAVFADPEGAVFCVWQAKEHQGATVVNEHGSLNFNDLNTRDLEGAKAFYGAVFGWETIDSAAARDVGPARLRRPPRAAQPRDARGHGRDGRARRASRTWWRALNPIPDDQPDTPAHWGVTFAVDDADAIAARAGELGGERGRAAVRRALGADDGHQRSAGRHVHREQVRAREQGPRRRNRQTHRARDEFRRARRGLSTHAPRPTDRRCDVRQRRTRPCWPKGWSSTTRAARATVEAVRGVDLEVQRRRDLRLPRPQRGRQVDDGADAHHAADDHLRSRRGGGHRRRPRARTRPAAGSASRFRRPASTRARPAASCWSCTGGCSASARRGGRNAREQLLALVELEDAADRVIKGYSGGMERRLDLAAALVHEPEVLFLDEPTTGPRPGQPADRLGGAAPDQRARDDGVPHDPVPRGGRPALRPHRDHRRRPHRARGHARGSSRPTSARAPGGDEEPTLDDVFLDATGRTRERAAGEVQEVAA